ncbi:DUF3592 domain-containing protein [Candidatus Saccharibacteria bacterium]|nr:DUF3592 domain-containing protein [Candidatus Saccharibacteria bacterium]
MSAFNVTFSPQPHNSANQPNNTTSNVSPKLFIFIILFFAIVCAVIFYASSPTLRSLDSTTTATEVESSSYYDSDDKIAYSFTYHYTVNGHSYTCSDNASSSSSSSPTNLTVYYSSADPSQCLTAQQRTNGLLFSVVSISFCVIFAITALKSAKKSSSPSSSMTPASPQPIVNQLPIQQPSPNPASPDLPSPDQLTPEQHAQFELITSKIRRIIGLVFVAPILLILFAPFLLIAFVSFFNYFQALKFKNYPRIEATANAVECVVAPCPTSYVYQVDGATYSLTIDNDDGIDQSSVPDKQLIVYDPNNPNSATFADHLPEIESSAKSSVFFTLSVVAILAVVAILIKILSEKFAKKQPPIQPPSPPQATLGN